MVGVNYHAFKYEKYHKEHPQWIIYGSETESTVSSRGYYEFPFPHWNWEGEETVTVHCHSNADSVGLFVNCKQRLPLSQSNQNNAGSNGMLI